MKRILSILAAIVMALACINPILKVQAAGTIDHIEYVSGGELVYQEDPIPPYEDVTWIPSSASESLKIRVYYTDGSNEEVTYTEAIGGDFSFSPSSGSYLGPGDNTETIIYKNDFEASFTVSVPDQEITGLSLSQYTFHRSIYYAGEKFDPTGLELDVALNIGINNTIFVSDLAEGAVKYSPSLDTPLTAADTKVTITILDVASVDIPITVDPDPVASISIKTMPTKTQYEEGEDLVLDGLVLTVVHESGTQEDISYLDISKVQMFISSPSVIDALTPDDTQVTVTYDGKTATFPITVTAKENPITGIEISYLNYPSHNGYIKGEAYDPRGLEIFILRNGKRSDFVVYEQSPDDFSFSPALGTPMTGDTEETITYKGFSATATIKLQDRSIDYINVSSEPMVYYESGDHFYPDGLMLRVAYLDNKTGNIIYNYVQYDEATDPMFSFSPSTRDELTTANRSVMIGYMGKTTKLLINVVKAPLNSISVSGNAVVGETLTASVTDPENATADYIWTADGTTIQNVTGNSLTLDETMVGKKIAVTATGNGEYQDSITSNDIGPVDAVVKEGDQQQLVPGSIPSTGAKFRFNGEFERATNVLLNGNQLTLGTDYNMSKGSTIVTLSQKLLNSLQPGKYTLQVNYQGGGKATATFTIGSTSALATSSTKSTGKDDSWCITYLDCKGNTVSVQWIKTGAAPVKPAGYNYPDISNVSAHQDVKPTSCQVSAKYLVPNTADKG